MTLIITVFSKITLSKMAWSNMTLSIKVSFTTLGVHNTCHKWHSAYQHYHFGEYHYAGCCFLFVVMLSAFLLNVVMLNVMVPKKGLLQWPIKRYFKYFFYSFSWQINVDFSIFLSDKIVDQLNHIHYFNHISFICCVNGTLTKGEDSVQSNATIT